MRKIILILIACIIVPFSAAFAGSINVQVNGMVCDFCAQALNEVFGKEEAIDTIAVDLDTQIVTITVKDGQTISDEKINKLIYWAGYDVESISRDDASVNKP